MPFSITISNKRTNLFNKITLLFIELVGLLEITREISAKDRKIKSISQHQHDLAKKNPLEICRTQFKLISFRNRRKYLLHRYHIFLNNTANSTFFVGHNQIQHKHYEIQRRTEAFSFWQFLRWLTLSCSLCHWSYIEHEIQSQVFNMLHSTASVWTFAWIWKKHSLALMILNQN